MKINLYSNWRPALAIIFVFIFHSWLVTQGTFEPFGTDILSGAFDSLGENLKNLDPSVRPDIMWYDGYNREGKRYIYFGFLPALLRILPNLAFPEQFGEWSRISCLIASMLVTLAVGSLHRLASSGAKASQSSADFWRASWMFGFALGTPIAFLISTSRIYHEAILWGMANALWGYWGVWKYQSSGH